MAEESLDYESNSSLPAVMTTFPGFIWRYRREQRLSMRMLRIGKELRERTLLNDLAAINHQHAAREKWNVVGTYNDTAVSYASVIPRPVHQAPLTERSARQVRGRSGRGPGSCEPRPGRCGDALQAYPLRGRVDRHTERRRDHRASRRPQGMMNGCSSRTSRPRPSRHKGPRREGQVQWHPLLRL
jgi:hypothetical protein